MDGLTHSQIDFILVSKRFQSAINKARTRTFTGPDIGSDHDLVMMTLKIKLAKHKDKDTNRVHFDLEKLKYPFIKREFQHELSNRLTLLLLLEHKDSQELCDQFTKIMTETADRKLGKRRRIKKLWITKEVLYECDKQRELKSKRNLGEEQMAQYRDANRKMCQALAKVKNEWIERQAAEIEDSLHRNNSKKAYEVVKQPTFCSKHNRTSCIEDQGGKLLTKGSEIAERWKNYCSELYNHAVVVDRDILKEDVETKRGG